MVKGVVCMKHKAFKWIGCLLALCLLAGCNAQQNKKGLSSQAVSQIASIPQSQVSEEPQVYAPTLPALADAKFITFDNAVQNAPVWSEDGSQLIVPCRNTLYYINTQGEIEKQITLPLRMQWPYQIEIMGGYVVYSYGATDYFDESYQLCRINEQWQLFNLAVFTLDGEEILQTPLLEVEEVRNSPEHFATGTLEDGTQLSFGYDECLPPDICLLNEDVLAFSSWGHLFLYRISNQTLQYVMQPQMEFGPGGGSVPVLHPTTAGDGAYFSDYSAAQDRMLFVDAYGNISPAKELDGMGTIWYSQDGKMILSDSSARARCHLYYWEETFEEKVPLHYPSGFSYPSSYLIKGGKLFLLESSHYQYSFSITNLATGEKQSYSLPDPNAKTEQGCFMPAAGLSPNGDEMFVYCIDKYYRAQSAYTLRDAYLYLPKEGSIIPLTDDSTYWGGMNSQMSHYFVYGDSSLKSLAIVPTGLLAQT